ncbi:hypothetical protein H5410_037714 [Solanum commersonii]|uniref:Uncharacterized protein n=1 Tax=Solanum commersonii TaxID=4109 RepID=A0A9J5Y8R5_SOLCO|nr:hypothetical protein H5410_037714 [Solanum commersonii]
MKSHKSEFLITFGLKIALIRFASTFTFQSLKYNLGLISIVAVLVGLLSSLILVWRTRRIKLLLLLSFWGVYPDENNFHFSRLKGGRLEEENARDESPLDSFGCHIQQTKKKKVN